MNFNINNYIRDGTKHEKLV